MESIRLTETVKKGGCAAKIAALELREILKLVHFPPRRPEVLIDGSHFDDAAVTCLSGAEVLIQTIDFFTPIVDDPKTFGKIAAANALSDIYAMGGTPKTALAVLAFPLATLPREVIAAILNGACEVLKEAETSLVGGHSIDDESLKFGLSVTGTAHPDKIWANRGAKVGDSLILTKPLGTGTLCAALKRKTLQEMDCRDALASMMLLNKVPQILDSELIPAIHSATDITGFGLSGHSLQLARASEVSLIIHMSHIPQFLKVKESLRNENLTKAHRTNKEYVQSEVFLPLNPLDELLIHDPQTSGGLLLSVESSLAQVVLDTLRNTFTQAAIIGEVTASTEKRVYFH
jgi:selenide,water dikinase